MTYDKRTCYNEQTQMLGKNQYMSLNTIL